MTGDLGIGDRMRLRRMLRRERHGDRGMGPYPGQYYPPLRCKMEVSKYAKTVSKFLGGMQIAMALLIFGLNLGLAVTDNDISMPVIATGLWAAPFIILAGSFGIAAGFKTNNCTIMTTLALSSFCGLAGVIVAVMGLLLIQDDDHAPSQIATHASLMLIALGELGFAITQSVFCLRPCSMGRDTTVQFQTNPMIPQQYNNANPVQYQGYPQGAQVVVAMPPGQNVAMPTGQYPGQYPQQYPYAAGQNVAMPAGQYQQQYPNTAEQNVAMPTAPTTAAPTAPSTDTQTAHYVPPPFYAAVPQTDSANEKDPSMLQN